MGGVGGGGGGGGGISPFPLQQAKISSKTTSPSLFTISKSSLSEHETSDKFRKIASEIKIIFFILLHLKLDMSVPVRVVYSVFMLTSNTLTMKETSLFLLGSLE